MATIDISRIRNSFLRDSTTLDILPPDLLKVIQDYQPGRFLDILASAAAQIPALEDRIFAHTESIFADICARWVNNSNSNYLVVIPAIARILPFAPYLSAFMDQAVRNVTATHLNMDVVTEEDLPTLLLALWRLNNFDRQKYSYLSKPSCIQALFMDQAKSSVTRYLAIRIF